ncbi:MAG: hypothetical protein WD269_01700 [Acidimicrobiia bacterium]
MSTGRAGPRRPGDGHPGAGTTYQELIHHSDAGCQYTSFRYTDRLTARGIAATMGSAGDS